MRGPTRSFVAALEQAAQHERTNCVGIWTTEIGNLRASFASFDEGIQLVGAGDQASVDQGNALINEAINYWANYEADAAAIAWAFAPV